MSHESLRSGWHPRLCGHWFNVHLMNMSGLALQLQFTSCLSQPVPLVFFSPWTLNILEMPVSYLAQPSNLATTPDSQDGNRRLLIEHSLCLFNCQTTRHLTAERLAIHGSQFCLDKIWIYSSHEFREIPHGSIRPCLLTMKKISTMMILLQQS